MEFDPHAGDALNRHHDINYSENEAEPCAAANGLPAVRSSVAGIRERPVRSIRAAEAVAQFCSLGRSNTFGNMEPDDFRKGDYLLPEGCKDLIDVLKLKPEQRPKLQWRKRNSDLPPIGGRVIIPAQTPALQLAALLNQKPSRIIADVIQLGISVTVEQQLDFWIIFIVARRHGFIAERAAEQPQPSDLCVIQNLDMEPRRQRVMAQLGKRVVYRGTGHLVPVTIESITDLPDYFSAELVAVDGIMLSYSKEIGKLPPKFSVGAQWQLLTEGRNKWMFSVSGCCWQIFLDEAKCDAIVKLYKQKTELDPDLFFKLANNILYERQIIESPI
jgi:hypothetical protein